MRTSVLLGFLVLTGCISRYQSDSVSPYGTRLHGSREQYGLIWLGEDRFETSREALTQCLSDRLAYQNARLDLEERRLELFRAQLPGYFPYYGLNGSGITDDHLLCLGIASGFDPAEAAAVAGSLAYGGGAEGGLYQQWRIP